MLVQIILVLRAALEMKYATHAGTACLVLSGIFTGECMLILVTVLHNSKVFLG